MPTIELSWGHFPDSAKEIPYKGVSVSRADCKGCTQGRDNDMPLTEVLIMRIMTNPQPEIRTLDDLAKWCAMPKGELQNHIAWCFKRFANFTDYIDHDQYCSRLSDAKSIWFNTVAILVPSFKCDEQAVHIVHCTGSTRCITHKPPRIDKVHLWMGRSPDSHF